MKTPDATAKHIPMTLKLYIDDKLEHIANSQSEAVLTPVIGRLSAY
jgi:hypothetical protein